MTEEEILRQAVLRAKITPHTLVNTQPTSDSAMVLRLKEQIAEQHKELEKLRNMITEARRLLHLNIKLVNPEPEPQPRKIKVADCLQAVVQFMGLPHITKEQVLGNYRRREICLLRHVVMYLGYKLTGQSTIIVGRALGGRDHTTVLHAIRHITALRAADEELDQKIALCERVLRKEGRGEDTLDTGTSKRELIPVGPGPFHSMSDSPSV